jgi:protein-tyrosine phosphatase
MIDIHSHILFGVDDGAETVEESLAMLKMAAQSGTTDIVATPHADLQFPFEPQVVSERLAQLRAAAGGTIRIHSGCDFHLMYDNIQDALKNPAKYSINGLGYLLVEFSDLVIFHNTEDVFERMQNVGLTPIVTHPERNPLLQQRAERLERWAQSGVLIQVTAQSFGGRFGNAAKRCADDLADRGLIHFVASDAHDTHHRPPRLDEAYEYIGRRCGQAAAERLFRTNPDAVIAGRPLPEVEEVPVRKRKWYQLWG